MDFRPMVIPYLHLHLFELVEQLRIAQLRERRYDHPLGAFNDGLAGTVQSHLAVEAIPHSELFCYGHNFQVFAIPQKYCAFAGCNEDGTVLAIVDIHIGCNVEDEE